MFRSSTTPSAEEVRQAESVGKVKAWVRELLPLGEGTSVMVTELRCTEVGCPPKETVVAVLRGPGDTRQEKIAVGVAELTRDDVAKLCDKIRGTSGGAQ